MKVFGHSCRVRRVSSSGIRFEAHKFTWSEKHAPFKIRQSKEQTKLKGPFTPKLCVGW